MYDIIWTIIGIWFLWKIIDAFRAVPSGGRSKTYRSPNTEQYTSNTSYNGNTASTEQTKKGELKSDAGEYIDYEEVK
jgi:hypothetical protein